VQIGSGGTSGSIGSAGVANNGLLAINRTGSLTISGPVNNSGTITHTASGTTTLTNPVYTGNGKIDISAGNLTFGTSNAARHGSAILVTTNNLSVVNNGSVLDLTNRDMMITNQTPASSNYIINTLWANGISPFFGNGNINGPQITSSTAINDTGNFPTFFVAYDIDQVFGGGVTGDGSGAGFSLGDFSNNQVVTQPGTIMVKFSYYADVDFNGKVDSGDLSTILGDFGMTTPGFADPGLSYILGDVDYSGKVDSGDLSSVLGAFGAGSGGVNGQPLGGLEGSLASSAAALGGAAANVPEPATLFLLGLGSAGMFLRRKRRNA